MLLVKELSLLVVFWYLFLFLNIDEIACNEKFLTMSMYQLLTPKAMVQWFLKETWAVFSFCILVF